MARAWIAAGWVMATVAVACTTPNPDYCDETTPCTRADTPYCNLSNNRCTANPDASVPIDASAGFDAVPDGGSPTCESLGAECGLVGDGKGGTLSCGGCTVPGEGCGGGGDPNRCGCVPGEWHFELLDEVGPQGGAIAVGSDGTIHVGYQSVADSQLKYAFRTSESVDWTIEIAAEGDPHGMSPSIAVGDDGVPNLLDWAPGAGPTHSVRSTDGDWTTEIVDPAPPGSFMGRTSLAMDASGNLHACYVPGLGSSGQIRYAGRLSAGVWTPTEDIDNIGDIGHCAIDADTDGTAHFVYADTFNNDLLHTEVTSGGDITTDTVAISAANSFSLVLADDGTIHAAYTDGSGALRHRFRNLGTSWSDREIDTGATSPVIRWLDDSLYVGYRKTSTADIHIGTRKSGGEWSTALAFTDDDGASQLDMFVEPSGAIHLTYVTSVGLRYARRCPPE